MNDNVTQRREARKEDPYRVTNLCGLRVFA